MQRAALQALAQRAGIEPHYCRIDGQICETSDATRERLLAAMGIDATTEALASAALASWDEAHTPARPAAAGDSARCASVGETQRFGMFAQLYSVRGDRDLGAGDFGTLHALVDWASEVGAAFVGLNPLHALDLWGADPAPYSPWSRLYLHALYADLDAIPELSLGSEAQAPMRSEAWRRDVERLRRADRVNHSALLRLKLAALRTSHRAFVERQSRSPDAHGRSFREFVATEGAALEDFARFAAIALHLGERDWRQWPHELHDARGDAVVRFAREHSDAVDLHRYIQFELNRQLSEVATHARQCGLVDGLYLDLAVGCTLGGADAWSQPTLFARGASIGAPPDAYAAEGQAWSLAPLIPLRLHDGGFAFFDALLDHAMRHAGMLRIDHAMGLRRQFWVPDGCPASEGAYVRFPEPDLLDRVARASNRHACVVVGEDLGTVPEGFRETMAQRRMLRSLILYFERGADGCFTAPAEYAQAAFVSANTHDLPTLRGFQEAVDVEQRYERGAIDAAQFAALRAERARDCDALFDLLRSERLLDATGVPTSWQLCRAAYELLARTPSMLLGVAVDDLGDEPRAVNVPGAADPGHLNWTRRMHKPLEAMRSDGKLRTWLQSLAAR